MRHKDVPGAGGKGSRQGSPALNRHLMTPQPRAETSTQTADMVRVGGGKRGWPTMYDMAKTAWGRKK